MFAIIYDAYGNIYDARVVSKGHESMREAKDRMRELVKADCEYCGLDAKETDGYIFESMYNDDHAFTPRGTEDVAYKIIEI